MEENMDVGGGGSIDSAVWRGSWRCRRSPEPVLVSGSEVCPLRPFPLPTPRSCLPLSAHSGYPPSLPSVAHPRARD